MLFKEGVKLIKTKAHLNKEGFNQILSIRAALNLGLSDELGLCFPHVEAVKKPLVQNTDRLMFYCLPFNPNLFSWTIG